MGIVSTFAVNEENGKIEHVEVSDGSTPASHLAIGSLADDLVASESSSVHDVAREPGGEAVSPRHDPVTEVVDVAGSTPPARSQETGTAGGLDVLEVLDVRVVGVGSELVLLAIAGTEDPVASKLDSHDEGDLCPAKMNSVDREVAGLNAVDEGNPDEITKGKHATETVRGDVHGGQDGGLVPQSVKNVPGLSTDDNVHGIGHSAVSAVLTSGESQVKQNPAQKTRSQLHESLDVDLPEDRDVYTRVEFPSNEPIVNHIASGTSLGKFAVVGVVGLDGEGANVAESGKEVGDEDVCRQQLQVVVIDEGPDREVGALEEGTSSGDGEDEHGRGEGVEAVVQSSARSEHNTLGGVCREEGIESETECVVSECRDNRFCVQETSNARPCDFLLELFQAKSGGIGQ